MENCAVLGLRISVKRDDSTSIERQEGIGRGEADRLRCQVVGVAVDENVSATKVGPLERPELGHWLLKRTHEFDTVIFWRLDRAVRSMNSFNELIAWAQKHQKRIVFCEGEAASFPFDYRPGRVLKKNSLEQIIVMMIAWAAGMETEATRDRLLSSHQYLRQNAEWGGGFVPFGFIPQRIPGKKRGWRLVHCNEEVTVTHRQPDGSEKTYTLPPTMPILRRIVDDVLRGRKLQQITRELNKEGVLTPRDWWSLYKGREAKDREWRTTGLKLILSNRTLLGEWWYTEAPEDATSQVKRKLPAKLVLDDEGNPVQRGEAVIQLAEFNKIQERMAENFSPRGQKYEKPNPFLGVALCARCGQQYYLKEEVSKGRLYRSFLCRSRNSEGFNSCGQPQIAASYVEKIVQDITLAVIGKEELKNRHFVPGSDQSEKKEKLKLRLKDLNDRYFSGELEEMSEAEYNRHRKVIKDQLDAIGEEAVREARFEWTGTGKLYDEVWEELNAIERGDVLRNLGVRVFLGRDDSPVAEEAWQSQGEFALPDLPISNRLAVALSETEVNEMLSDLTDHVRIKKNFKVWYLQQADAFPREILERLSL